MMGCCGKKPEGEKKPKSLKKRSCTDVLCLILFIAFCGLLAFICGLAYYTGDWASLVYEQDYLGNRCGVGEYADKPKAFYPRIPRDLLEQNDIVASGSVTELSKLRLYALCVEECPTEFNINDPMIYTDYGWDPTTAVTQALGSGTQEKWISATPTVDIMNRCIPRTESSGDEVSMCAYPNCTDARAVAVGAVCANTESFSSGEWAVCAGTSSGSGPDLCAEQQDVCMVRARETTTMTYELSTSDEASKAMLANIANSVGGVFEIMSSISQNATMIIIGGIVLPILLAFLYMLLLFLFARVIIYGLLFLLFVSQLVATFVCFSRSGISFGGVSGDSLLSSASAELNVTVPDSATSALGAVQEDSQWIYAVGFLILAITTVITLVTILLARRKIAICAAIIKEATTVFVSMPLLMFFPSLSTLVQIGVCAWFIITMVLVQTQKGESIDAALGLAINTSTAEFISAGVAEAVPDADPIAGLRDLITGDMYQNFCFVITLFGYFTLLQWVGGIAWCTMSGATYYWYFFRNAEGDDEDEKTRVPIFRSLTRTLFYHSGSVAFAAFVIAICDMLRAAASYVEAQMGPSNNQLVKLAFKALHCAIWCLRKTVKFVSYYGLVFVSCQGLSFCLGCYRTFFFFLQNPGQVSINATVVTLLRLLALLCCPLFCAVAFYYVIESGIGQDDNSSTKVNAMYPGVIIYVLAAVMTTSCMTVFECTITTIFVCCFQDKAEFGGKYMSERLAKAFHIKQDKGDKKDDMPAPKKDVDATLQSL